MARVSKQSTLPTEVKKTERKSKKVIKALTKDTAIPVELTNEKEIEIFKTTLERLNGALTVLDLGDLVRYCQLEALSQKIKAEIDSESIVSLNSQGIPFQNPKLGAMLRLFAQASQHAKALRKNVDLSEKEEDELDF